MLFRNMLFLKITFAMYIFSLTNMSFSQDLDKPIHIYTWHKVHGASFYEGVIWTSNGPQTFQTQEDHISIDIPAKVYVKAFTLSGIPFVSLPQVVHTMSFRRIDKTQFIKIPVLTPPPPITTSSLSLTQKEQAKKKKKEEKEEIIRLEKEQKAAFNHEPFRFLRLHTGLGSKKLDITGDEIEFSGQNGYFSIGFEFFSKLSKKHFFRTAHQIHNFSIKKKNENSATTTTETIQNKDHSFEILSHWYIDFTLGIEFSTYPSLVVSHAQTGSLDLQENYQSTYLLGLEWAKEFSEKFSFRLLGHISRDISSKFMHTTIKFRTYYAVSPLFQIYSSLENHKKTSDFLLKCPNGSELSICGSNTKGTTQFSELDIGIGFHF
ncbi:MAG: hypothetical protein AB8C84_05715 [Oligoflexales bacterium]